MSTDPEDRICRRYFTGTIILCKIHGRDLDRCETRGTANPYGLPISLGRSRRLPDPEPKR